MTGPEGPPIATPRNARVQGARRLARRAFRHSERRFLVEGQQAVTEALAEPGDLLELFVTADAAARHAGLVERARAYGVPVHAVTESVMAALAQTVTPQGLLGISPFRDTTLDVLIETSPKLVVVLASVRDPGNAGTILRVADAAGAEGVVFTDESVDPYNPKCVRSSAGSLFHVPFVAGPPVERVVEALQAAGLTVLAADARGTDDLETADLAGPTAWLFGNEAWGLPEQVVALADRTVRVPIHGRAESLNLATAAAVCLYASAGAQRRPGGCRT